MTGIRPQSGRRAACSRLFADDDAGERVTHVTGACISTVTRARVRINQNKCHMRHLSSIGPVGFFFYPIDFNADKAARSIFSSQAVASGLEVLPEPLGATGVFA